MSKEDKSSVIDIKDEEEDDPWAVLKDEENDIGWSELSGFQKTKYVVFVIIKTIILLGFVYLFICSLGFLGAAFKLLGGETAGKVFQKNHILSNPVAGLMIGVLATAIIQSSSTTISIVITMAGSGIIPVRYTIPIVMGANIGTTVTNTVVSLVQIKDKKIFRRAFGGATVHDIFNCLTVIILLPTEAASGYLYYLTKAIISHATGGDSPHTKKKDILKKITKPFIKLFVQVDKTKIKDLAAMKEVDTSATVLKRWCKSNKQFLEIQDVVKTLEKDSVNSTYLERLANATMNFTMSSDGENITVSWKEYVKRTYPKRCSSLFALTNLSDDVIGIILLLASLLLIIVCLIIVVKLLNSIFRGTIARVVKKFINSNFPGALSWLTGYVAILIGAGLTMVIQSSSILTSTLTPLVGVGLLSIDRMFPLTVGANIGTTLTGILAALAAPASRIPITLQVALCHLFFNISGALIFYPVPVIRKIPIQIAKKLGTVTAEYRWFSVVYLAFVFFGIPAAVFALSLAGDTVIMGVGIPILTILIVIVIINLLQRYCPKVLPSKLRTWNFLPVWLRSLEPYDKALCHCCSKTNSDAQGNCVHQNDKNEHFKKNEAFDSTIL